MKTSEQWIRAASGWHQRWLKETGPGILAECDDDVRRYVAERTFSAVRQATIPLSSLATYYGIQGDAKLLTGDPNAWNEIRLSNAFSLEYLRLRFALSTKVAAEPGLDFEVPKIACALCFCLANGLNHWAQFLTDVLAQAERDEGLVSISYWRRRVFEPFALRLAQYAVKCGSTPPAKVESLGIYSAVFNNWDSPSRLSEALEALCDYHCQNMYYDEDDHRDEDGDEQDERHYEFDDPPSDLVPWEILAIREVRKHFGLETTEPAHPLLTPLRTFVPQNELPFDERLNAIEELARSHYMTVDLP